MPDPFLAHNFVGGNHQPQPPVAPRKETKMIKPVAAQPHDANVVEVEEVK
jgi:hypothetical protein